MTKKVVGFLTKNRVRPSQTILKLQSITQLDTMLKSTRWLEQWRLQVAAELHQWWRRTNRRRKSIRRSSSSHREGSITQRGVSCGRSNQS